jgi:hypothetical protein
MKVVPIVNANEKINNAKNRFAFLFSDFTNNKPQNINPLIIEE